MNSKPKLLYAEDNRLTAKEMTEILEEEGYEELTMDGKVLTGKAWIDVTKENVDDISRSVGYENISYFHRIFRAKYHMGPKEYRDARKDTFLDK